MIPASSFKGNLMIYWFGNHIYIGFCTVFVANSYKGSLFCSDSCQCCWSKGADVSAKPFSQIGFFRVSFPGFSSITVFIRVHTACFHCNRGAFCRLRSLLHKLSGFVQLQVPDEWQCHCLIFFWSSVLIFFIWKSCHSASVTTGTSLFTTKDKSHPLKQFFKSKFKAKSLPGLCQVVLR